MKPGIIGAVLVIAGGAAAGGAVFLRDASQLERARRAGEDAPSRLAQGDLDGARRAWEEALVAADAVGGLTGKRAAALDVADAARAGLLALDGLADPVARPLAPARAAGGEALLGAPVPAAVKAIVDRGLAERFVEAGLTLEGRTHDTPAALEVAPRVLTLAVEAARAAGSPRAEEAEQARARSALRAALHRSELAVRADKDAEVATELAGLDDALTAAASAFQPGEAAELRGRILAAVNEAHDVAAARDFRAAVQSLADRVPSDGLGSLRPEADALKAPALLGKHARIEGLTKQVAEADERLTRVKTTCADFEGMVLVDASKGLYLDATEVTNEAYAAFVNAKGYDPAAAWWTDEGKRVLERFIDATGRPGPRGWKDGLLLPGKARHPVTGVSALEAQAFAAWRGKRVPTLEEWRQAAGGAAYPWGDAFGTGRANLKGTGPDDTEPVGSHPDGRSPCGALDLVGNAREVVLVPGQKPVVVGGSFQVLPAQATLTNQLEVPVTSRAADTGFRCVRVLSWP